MAKVTVDDFTKPELIKTLCDWIESPELDDYCEELEISLTPGMIAHLIRSGSWLDIINKKLEKETTCL